MCYNCVATLFVPNAAKYLPEVHQREEIESTTTIIALHHAEQDSNLKRPMNYFPKNKKAYTQARHD